MTETMHPLKESAIQGVKGSLHWLLNAANNVPADKLDWNPGGKATSTLDILKHCAAFPAWIIATLERGEYAPEDWASAEMVSASINNFEDAKRVLETEANKLADYIAKFPEEKLNNKIAFPWQETTCANTLTYFDWNNTYHTGQISYIQLCYGDTEMYM